MLRECTLVSCLLFSGSNCEMIFNFFIMIQNHSMHTTKMLGCFLNCMYVFLFTFVVLQEEIHIPHSNPCNRQLQSPGLRGAFSMSKAWCFHSLACRSEPWVAKRKQTREREEETLATHPQGCIWFLTWSPLFVPWRTVPPSWEMGLCSLRSTVQLDLWY